MATKIYWGNSEIGGGSGGGQLYQHNVKIYRFNNNFSSGFTVHISYTDYNSQPVTANEFISKFRNTEDSVINFPAQGSFVTKSDGHVRIITGFNVTFNNFSIFDTDVTDGMIWNDFNGPITDWHTFEDNVIAL